MKVFLFFTRVVLTTVSLIIIYTQNVTAQAGTSFPYDTTGSTTYNPNGQTAQVPADPNFQEMNIRTLMGIRRLEIKICVDQMAIQGQDNLLAYLADKMELAEDDSGWLRITDFYTFAQLSALNTMRANLKILAGKKLRSCNLKPVNDAQAIAAQTGVPATGQSTGDPYTADSLSVPPTPVYPDSTPSADPTITDPNAPATPVTDPGIETPIYEDY